MNYFKKHYSIIIVALMILFAVICGAYIYQAYDNSFNHHISPIPTKSNDSVATLRAEWGQLGDFFGGTLNPIFGFLSFVGLLLTLLIQIKSLEKSSEELELSREELAKSSNALALQNKAIELQSFEQTFFSWLSTYRELLNSASETNDLRQPFQGREALYHLWKNKLDDYTIYDSMCTKDNFGTPSLNPIFDDSYDSTFYRLSYYKKIELIADNKQDLVANHIHQIWSLLYQRKEYQLDSLFRTAYRLISWIDSQQPERLTEQQKWMYISIFRSQLSWIEMVFLYYNGLTGSGKKFKLLIEKYALLDNLTFDSDIGIKVMNKYFDIENNYSKTAFNSELAREISN